MRYLRSMVRLIAFLGNPGKEYQYTRHNAPWLIAKGLSYAGELSWQRKFKGEYADYAIGHGKVYLHRPLTYMNKSGESLSAIAAFYDIDPQQILIVHDEVELDFGEIGLKYGGGLSGHNGLRSAESHLGTRDFYRLRIGTGRPRRGSVSSHVLGKLSEAERLALREITELAENVMADLVADTAHPSGLLARYRRYLVLRI
jgi:peptidyl-tRNA hydrolase, PTH1 family